MDLLFIPYPQGKSGQGLFFLLSCWTSNNSIRSSRAYLSIIKYFPSPPAIPIGLIKGFFLIQVRKEETRGRLGSIHSHLSEVTPGHSYSKGLQANQGRHHSTAIQRGNPGYPDIEVSPIVLLILLPNKNQFLSLNRLYLVP